MPGSTHQLPTISCQECQRPIPIASLESTPRCRDCQISLPLAQEKLPPQMELLEASPEDLEDELRTRALSIASAPSRASEAEHWAVAEHLDFEIRRRLADRCELPDLLWHLVDDDHHRVRLSIARNGRDANLLKRLATDDPDPRVRVAALLENRRNLQYHGRQELLEALANDPDRELRLVLARHRETPTEVLLTLHGDDDKEVKAAARHTLGRDAPYRWADGIEYGVYTLIFMVIASGLIALFFTWLL